MSSRLLIASGFFVFPVTVVFTVKSYSSMFAFVHGASWLQLQITPKRKPVFLALKCEIYYQLAELAFSVSYGKVE